MKTNSNDATSWVNASAGLDPKPHIRSPPRIHATTTESANVRTVRETTRSTMRGA
jgi:hypothetical protein